MSTIGAMLFDSPLSFELLVATAVIVGSVIALYKIFKPLNRIRVKDK